jgi:hypothetical protein
MDFDALTETVLRGVFEYAWRWILRARAVDAELGKWSLMNADGSVWT